MKTIKTNYATGIAALALLSLSLIVSTALQADAPLPGAIFTTDSTCSGVDLNIYGSKSDVYVDGGPAHPGAAGLPDGSYCVRVTDPSGATILGQSAEGAVTVVNGSFVTCYQLTAILNTGSSNFTVAGYDDTPNIGGEYKVWVSPDCTFTNSSTKTDNFKVKEGGGGPGGLATLCVNKFYDANTNGVQDDPILEPNLTGWEYCVIGDNNFSALRFTNGECMGVDPDNYCVTEGTPVEGNWVHTTDTQSCFTLAADGTQNVSFGNVCLGAGGGLTLGFWSNKNGQSLERASDLCFLNTLNLVNASGTSFDPIIGCPSPSATQLATGRTNLSNWLLSANATNMAYMLSAQLAAMELNVRYYGVSNKFGAGVNPNALVYEQCLTNYAATLNAYPSYHNGFISVSDLMAAANASLLAHPNTPSGDPNRAYQECLKNALDDANNNKNFVESQPCPFSFNISDACPFTNP